MAGTSVKTLAMKSRYCPLCGTASRRLLYSDRNRRDGMEVTASYYRCTDCGMVYLDPIPDFSRFEGWDEVYAHSGPGRRSRLLRWFSGMMWHWNGLWDWRSRRLQELPPGPGEIDGRRRRILDLGCGNGAQLQSFAQRGWEVWGVDMSEAAIAQARGRLPDSRFLHCSAEQADLPGGYFDAVRASHLWEHLEDPVSLGHKSLRVLRPGGQLFFYVPNHGSLLQACAGRYNINSWVPFHVNSFTRRTARAALQAAGFEQVQVRTNTPTTSYPLALRQFLTRKQPSFDTADLGWSAAWFIIASPLHHLVDAAGLGDELVIRARRPA